MPRTTALRSLLLCLLCAVFASLLGGCHRQRPEPRYATLRVTSDEWDVWLEQRDGPTTDCTHGCTVEVPVGRRSRMRLGERGSGAATTEVSVGVRGSTAVRIGRDRHEALHVGGAVMLTLGLGSLAADIGVMYSAFQAPHSVGEDLGLGVLTFFWSILSLGLSITGSALVGQRDSPTVEVVPWGMALEDGGGIGGLAGTF